MKHQPVWLLLVVVTLGLTLVRVVAGYILHYGPLVARELDHTPAIQWSVTIVGSLLLSFLGVHLVTTWRMRAAILPATILAGGICTTFTHNMMCLAICGAIGGFYTIYPDEFHHVRQLPRSASHGFMRRLAALLSPWAWAHALGIAAWISLPLFLLAGWTIILGWWAATLGSFRLDLGLHLGSIISLLWFWRNMVRWRLRASIDETPPAPTEAESPLLTHESYDRALPRWTSAILFATSYLAVALFGVYWTMRLTHDAWTAYCIHRIYSHQPDIEPVYQTALLPAAYRQGHRYVIRLRCDHGMPNRVLPWIGRLRFLESIELHDDDFDVRKASVLAGLTQLRRLQLNVETSQADSFRMLSDRLRLDYATVYLGRCDSETLAAVASLPNLYQLRLGGFIRANASQPAPEAGPAPESVKILDQLTLAKRLTQLDLESCELDDAMLAYMPTLPSLQSLSLSGNRLEGTTLEGLQGLPNLISLDLTSNPLSILQLNRLSLLSLKHLDLSDTHQRPWGDPKRVRRWGKTPNLSVLSWHDSKITDDHLYALVPFLPNGTLALDGYDLTPACVPLLEACEQCEVWVDPKQIDTRSFERVLTFLGAVKYSRHVVVTIPTWVYEEGSLWHRVQPSGLGRITE